MNEKSHLVKLYRKEEEFFGESNNMVGMMSNGKNHIILCVDIIIFHQECYFLY